MSPSRIRKTTRWLFTTTPGSVLLTGLLAIGIIITLIIAVAAQYKAADVARSQAVESAARAADSASTTQRIQDALCGSRAQPGIFVVVAQASTNVQTSALGRQLVIGAKHAVQVLHCPPPQG